jgi:NADH:ubiquinone oxidoreductase subunit C
MPCEDLTKHRMEVRSKVEKMLKSGARFVVLAANDIGDGKFEVIYLFHHMGELLEVRLCVGIDEVVPTITDLFPAAAFLEREMVDLFGVNVEGAAPNLLLEPGSGIEAPLRKRREKARPKAAGPAERAADPPSREVGA